MDQGAVGMLVVGDITITGPAGLDVAIDSWFGEDAPAAPEGLGDVVIELTGFAGGIAIRGTDYEVTIDGVTTLHGAGSGEATFDGKGLWKTRRDRGLWPGSVSLSAQDAA